MNLFYSLFYVFPATFASALWGQQGGLGDLIWGVLLVLFIIFQAVRAVREANQQKQQELTLEAARLKQAEEAAHRGQNDRERHRERKKKQRPLSTSYESEAPSQSSDHSSRNVLAKELAPQGEGQRFEADPGTFDPSHLVAPSIESTVKPTLESMTGIYEAAPVSSELQDQTLTLSDIKKLIARPDGIRQAVLLAEILKRPEY